MKLENHHHNTSIDIDVQSGSVIHGERLAEIRAALCNVKGCECRSDGLGRQGYQDGHGLRIEPIPNQDKFHRADGDKFLVVWEV